MQDVMLQQFWHMKSCYLGIDWCISLLGSGEVRDDKELVKSTCLFKKAPSIRASESSSSEMQREARRTGMTGPHSGTDKSAPGPESHTPFPISKTGLDSSAPF